MADMKIPVPTFLADRLKELAAMLEVSVDMLANYFFARGVVHT